MLIQKNIYTYFNNLKGFIFFFNVFIFTLSEIQAL